ncbi:acyltransferase family protein [Vibrio sp. ABG19]|uniref:acyltransferase family protein n=1 Tax=Vibrio sp. ABG19 TaxID=2817385 RepID=UPI00249DA8FB|nr:acyltransferase family protein [Vibrio sp. ABG19]WGY48434.1 acyltransferase family protein [Vibrio sp. ABG19]
MDYKVERNFKIDFLRGIGILLIIFAHIDPPDFLFQLRNFDVPMMIFLSGVSFSLSYKSIPYVGYVVKRIFRLVFPTWLFLTLLFLFSFDKSYVNIENVLKSYSLISGIGYVWFIRIIFIFSILSPIIYCSIKKINSNKIIVFIIFIFFILNESLMYVFIDSIGAVSRIFLFDWLGYLPLFVLGMVIFRLRKLEMNLVFLFFGLVTFYYIISGVYDIQSYKYPPRGIFISYGMFVSLILWNYVSIGNEFIKSAIGYISRNSIWIYLFHIVFIINLSSLTSSWIANYFIVVSGSLMLVALKNIALSMFERRKEVNKNLKSILMG